MSLSEDTRKNSPWEFPDCPNCGRHIYVDRWGPGEFDFQCHKCGLFNAPEYREQEPRKYHRDEKGRFASPDNE